MNTIKTTGAGSPVSTPSTGINDTGAWLRAHTKAVQDSGAKLGDTLTTTWADGNVPTTRTKGESDAAFLARHMALVAAAMKEDVPVL